MLIRAGFEIAYDCPAPCPMILMLGLRPERRGDLRSDMVLTCDRDVELHPFLDVYGNECVRVLAPPGRITFTSDFVIEDDGLPDLQSPGARQHPVDELPDEALLFLLPSRYCETELLADLAWRTFGSVPPGWARVQAIVDYSHRRIGFDYQKARATRTAREAHEEQFGVCRDYAHLAVTLCRCMNIPARYCTGYLGDIGVPPIDAPMDFSAWFEVYLEGAWRTFDARHNKPRIGRIMMAYGRDATDVAITTHFGQAILAGFTVVTDEVAAA